MATAWASWPRRGKLSGVFRPRLARALVVIACLGLAACASSGSEEAVGSSSSTPDLSSADPAPALGVVLGGDSVMESLVPAIRSALGGQAQVDYLAAPTISTASDRAAWQAGIQELDPDLVVVLLGSWEVLQPGFAPTEAGWAATYAREVLDPLAASLTAGGARVLWVEMHTSTKVVTTLSLAVLGAQVRALTERNDAVEWIDAGGVVDGPGGVIADVLPGPDGTPQRIRRLDGTGAHLCPAGVARLAGSVLDWITSRTDEPVTLVTGWEGARWSRPPDLDHPEQCPPATDPARSTTPP